MLAHSFAGADTGPLVVFLHAAGTTSWMWEPVINQLPNRRIMTIDLPGHGESNQIPWRSLEHAAALVHQTVTQAGSQANSDPDFHLVALSLGSYVAMNVLAQQPTDYASATLSGMHSGGMPNKVFMQIISWLTAPLAAKPFMARQTAKMLGGAETDIEAFVREARKNDPGSLRRATLDAVNFELPEGLESVQTRVMMAAGSKEHQHILATQAAIVEALAYGQSYLAKGLGHGWSMEDPEQFANLVDRQIAGRQAG